MQAAVITDFALPPVYREHPEPVVAGENEMLVDVLAAGLHHLTRSRANGSHYSSSGVLPIVPGMDGVVRDASGRLRYVVLDDSALGTFADRTVIDARRSVVLPDGVDPVRIAAAMNPGMSSWIALRRRITFEKGRRVLVLGATGNSGRLAVQIAKLFGASQVIAAGRDRARLQELRALGADDVITFDEAEKAAGVDVVIDYLWGDVAAGLMLPMLRARPDRSVPLTWIQIGSMAGPEAAIPSAALRQARLQIVGSGIGSVPARDIIAELPALAAAVTDGSLEVQAQAVPLAAVAGHWEATTGGRMVFVP